MCVLTVTPHEGTYVAHACLWRSNARVKQTHHFCRTTRHTRHHPWCYLPGKPRSPLTSGVDRPLSIFTLSRPSFPLTHTPGGFSSKGGAGVGDVIRKKGSDVSCRVCVGVECARVVCGGSVRWFVLVGSLSVWLVAVTVRGAEPPPTASEWGPFCAWGSLSRC